MLVKKRNSAVDGVGVINRVLGFYRPAVRAQKWYHEFLINSHSVFVDTPWQLQRSVDQKP